MMGITWTEERIELLRGMWADEGLSAKMIVLEFGKIGISVSRNAVLGAVHRYKMASRKAFRRSADIKQINPLRRERVPAVRSPKFVIRRSAKWAVLKPADAVAPAPKMCDAEIPVKQRKNLLELQNNHCRWPVGDPATSDFFFCGAEADLIAGRPYCPGHTRAAMPS